MNFLFFPTFQHEFSCFNDQELNLKHMLFDTKTTLLQSGRVGSSGFERVRRMIKRVKRVETD